MVKKKVQSKQILRDVTIGEIKPYEKNYQKHNNIDHIANSIKDFGFIKPIIVDNKNVILAGHGCYKACEQLGMKKIPIVFILFV